MIGAIIARPAANGALPKWRGSEKKPRSAATTRIGSLMDQTFIFLHRFSCRL
jgi:hypothetical protein